MLAGDMALLDSSEEDLDYVRDLGLVRDDGILQVANPIYREVIPRQLTHAAQGAIPRRAASFVDSEAGWTWRDCCRTSRPTSASTRRRGG